MRLQPVVAEFQDAEGVALAYAMQSKANAQRAEFPPGDVFLTDEGKTKSLRLPLRSADSRSHALMTLTWRKPTSLRFFKDL